MSAILVPALTGGGSATVMLTGLVTFGRSALRRVAADVVREVVKDIATDVTDLKVKLAAETGGNSNGLRQAVNSLQKDVTDVKVDLAAVKATVAVTAVPKAAA